MLCFRDVPGTQPDDVVMMGNAARNQGAMSLHFGAFLPTLMSQSTEEQKADWLWRAYTMKIVGCLAQTELGQFVCCAFFPGQPDASFAEIAQIVKRISHTPPVIQVELVGLECPLLGRKAKSRVPLLTLVWSP